jgi:hypothetical protein
MTEPIVDVLPASPPPPLRLSVGAFLLDSNGHEWKVRAVCEVSYGGPVSPRPGIGTRLACYRLDSALLLDTYDRIDQKIRDGIFNHTFCSCGQCNKEPTT